MPGSSNPELHGGQRLCPWLPIHMGGQPVLDKGWFCGRCPLSSPGSRLCGKGLYGPQLPNWRGHHGISVWHPGLPNQTLGRWDSSAYTRYIRTPPDVLRGVAKVLSKDQSSS